MPFQYQPFDSGPWVQTIGQLMRAGPDAQARALEIGGQAAAQAAQQSGQAWAGAIQNVGQAIAQVPGQILAARRADQEQQIRDLQIGQYKREVSAADRLEATKRQVNTFMNDPTVINPDGTFNIDSMAKKAAGPLPNGAVGPTEAPDRLT